MTRLVMEGRDKFAGYLHPALGRYYQCGECGAIFEVDNLSDISIPVRVHPDYWGHVRCPFCEEWVDLSPRPADPPKRSPWFIDWLTLGLALALLVVTAVELI